MISEAEGEDDVLVNDPIFVSGEEEDFTPIHLAEGEFEGLEDEFNSDTDETDIPLASLQDDDNEDGGE